MSISCYIKPTNASSSRHYWLYPVTRMYQNVRPANSFSILENPQETLA